MYIASLEALGVPPQLLRVWEAALSTELLPIQECAVVHHQVLSGRSLIVQAPTSAGKTFIGEMAAARAALAGRKALYLVPTKALAEEKLAQFARLYRPLGLQLIACTRDRRGDDHRFATGDFDIAIAIPEKVRALWAQSGVSQFLGLAVIDELQMLSDPERGPCLELILAQLRSLPHLQIIGLSACLGASARLAEYLGADWLESKERPVELRKGIVVGEEFRYLTEHGQWVSEPVSGAGVREGDSYNEAAARLAQHFASRGEQTLIFVRDRATALTLAHVVAEGRAQNETPASALVGLERTAVRERLQYLLSHRVAFHSAELQFEDRRCVEAAFAAGEIDVLCATPTLALGVNLPARNVILDPQGWQSEKAGGAAAIAPLSRAEYENRAGRAGRLGHGSFGRAMLLADSELAAAALTTRYLQADFSIAEPSLGALPPLQAVLQLSAAAATTSETLEETYRGTYTAYRQGHRTLPEPLQQAAEQGVGKGILRQTAIGSLTPTVTGRLAGVAGLGVETALSLTRWAAEAAAPPSNLEATLLASLTSEAQECLTWNAGTGQDHGEALRQLALECAEARALLEALLSAPEHDWRTRDRAARHTLALWRWLGPEETCEVEQAVRLSAARLETLGETVGWIVDTLAELGAECGWPASECRRLRRHADCLAFGCPVEGLRLARLRVPGLGRDSLRALIAAGLQSKQEVRASEFTRLLTFLPRDTAEALREACQTRVPPAVPQSPAPPPVPSSSPPPPSTAPTGSLMLSTDRPDRAVFYGQAVALRPAEFRLLHALAESPGKCVRYAALYERMWQGDHFVEPGQIYSHRSRLCGKLAAALPDRDPKEIVVTVPRHGLMLNLPREEVLLS